MATPRIRPRRRGPLPLLRRALWVTVLVPMLLLGTAVSASAAASTGRPSAPGALSWMNITDSHGISIWNYELSLDRGGITNPGKFGWAFVTDGLWGMYRMYVSIAIWIINWTLSFAWLDTLAKPAYTIADAMHQVIARFGLTPTLLTLTAITGVVWMMRGRLVMGLYEIFMSLLISTLAVGVFANPVDLVAGQDGLLIQARDTGLGIAAGISNKGDTSASPDQLRANISQTLADTFIRQPTELINFGKVLDGGRCEKTYTTAVKAGPYGDDSDELRSKVGTCDPSAEDVANNPDASMAISAATLYPASLVVLLLAIVIAGAVLYAGVMALFKAVLSIWHMVQALLPGGARGGLWLAIADVLMSAVVIVFSVVFLASYLLVIRAFFADGGNQMKTFLIVDVMLVIGIIVYWRGRARLRGAADRLAAVMSRRPGGTASASPQRGTLNPTDLYAKGRIAATVGRGALGAADVAGAASGAAIGTGGRVAGAAAKTSTRPVTTAFSRIGFASGVASMLNDTEQSATGDSATDGAAGSSGASTGRSGPTADAGAPAGAGAAGGTGAASRLADRVALAKGRQGGGTGRQLARMAGSTALAAATGGTSAAARVAAQSALARPQPAHGAAAAARRAALLRAMNPGGSSPRRGLGTSSTSSTPPPRARGPVVRGEVLAASASTSASTGPATPTPSSMAASARGPAGGRAAARQVADPNRAVPAPSSAAAQPRVPASATLGVGPDDAARRLRARLEARGTRPANLPTRSPTRS